MPSYGPEVFGPPARQTTQKYWDPEIQTMDPEKMRALQEERLRTLLGKVFDNPVPLFRDKLMAAGINSPDDIQRSFGITSGHIFHGELALHQIFFLRPAPGWAQYKTPVKNLWMCGSSAHPGGCITGAPGRNAALAILRDEREGRPS